MEERKRRKPEGGEGDLTTSEYERPSFNSGHGTPNGGAGGPPLSIRRRGTTIVGGDDDRTGPDLVFFNRNDSKMFDGVVEFYV